MLFHVILMDEQLVQKLYNATIVNQGAELCADNGKQATDNGERIIQRSTANSERSCPAPRTQHPEPRKTHENQKLQRLRNIQFVF